MMSLGSLSKHVASFALAAGLLLAAASAHAGRPRVEAPVASPPPQAGGPVTPEPAAGLAFAIGLGVVVWAVRRNRK